MDYAPHTLRFLLQWLEHDRAACVGVSNRRAPGMPDWVRRPCRAVLRRRAQPSPAAGVGRGRTRLYLPLPAVIDGLPAHGYVHAVAEAERRICRAHPIDCRPPLTNKFLWLRFGSPILVYDCRARTALGVSGRNLPAFDDSWRARYSRDEAALQDTCGQ